MKITTGTAKGRQVTLPKNTNTRPTSDRVKQALFNRLGNLTGIRALDLFCGSGNLGLECLSRGAEWLTFVDKEKSCLQSVEDHCRRFGFDRESWMALHLDWQAALNKMLTAEPFDLVFLDPPYGDHLEMALLENQALYELVKPGGKLSLEHPSNYQPSATFRWELQDRNSYGETTIDLYQKSQA